MRAELVEDRTTMFLVIAHILSNSVRGLACAPPIVSA